MKEFTGKTVEAAVEAGLKELGLEKENAVINVIDEGSKGGVFGIGAKNAIVEIEKKQSDAQKAVNFLEGLFNLVNVAATTEIVEDDEKVVLNVISTSSSSLIGYRGEVLDALQTLAGAVANTGNENYKRIVVDCENYRNKREDTLKSLAEKLADKALRLGKKVALEPMNPFERRVIHSALSENEHVKTESEGKEPARYVVIIPDNCDPNDTREIHERLYNNDYKNGNKGGYGKKDGYRKNNGNNKGIRNGRGSGFKSDMIKSTVKTSGFGTFLGNSLKNDK